MAGMTPFILNALPTTLVPSALYFIKDAAHATKMSVYVASNDGLTTRRLPNAADITAEIAAALAATSGVDFKATIAARDSATYTANALVYVQDATADTTVVAGSAMYFYIHADDTFIKVTEFESMDLQLTYSVGEGGASYYVNYMTQFKDFS